MWASYAGLSIAGVWSKLPKNSSRYVQILRRGQHRSRMPAAFYCYRPICNLFLSSYKERAFLWLQFARFLNIRPMLHMLKCCMYVCVIIVWFEPFCGVGLSFFIELFPDLFALMSKLLNSEAMTYCKFTSVANPDCTQMLVCYKCLACSQKPA